MLATYNEIDLPGELQSECCDDSDYETGCDCFCHEAEQPECCAEHPAGCPPEAPATATATIITFPTPGGWEPDPSSPAACALCEEEGASGETGLCRICARRLPRAGGCGLALQIVAGLTGSGDQAAGAIAHLTECRECRQFFDRLEELARAATLDADCYEPAAVPVAA